MAAQQPNPETFRSMSVGPLARIARVYSNANSETGNLQGRWIVVIVLDSDSKITHEYTDRGEALADYYALAEQLAHRHHLTDGLAYAGHGETETPGIAKRSTSHDLAAQRRGRS